jgi:hypothetical protein
LTLSASSSQATNSLFSANPAIGPSCSGTVVVTQLREQLGPAQRRLALGGRGDYTETLTLMNISQRQALFLTDQPSQRG